MHFPSFADHLSPGWYNYSTRLPGSIPDLEVEFPSVNCYFDWHSIAIIPVPLVARIGGNLHFLVVSHRITGPISIASLFVRYEAVFKGDSVYVLRLRLCPVQDQFLCSCLSSMRWLPTKYL